MPKPNREVIEANLKELGVESDPDSSYAELSDLLQKSRQNLSEPEVEMPDKEMSEEPKQEVIDEIHGQKINVAKGKKPGRPNPRLLAKTLVSKKIEEHHVQVSKGRIIKYIEVCRYTRPNCTNGEGSVTRRLVGIKKLFKTQKRNKKD